MKYSCLNTKSVEVYNELVHFRKNLFKVPSGRAGKEFVTEITFWLKQLNSSTKINGIAMRMYMILPTLLQQKPSARSKAKDHTNTLDRRLAAWKKGGIDELIREVRVIQGRFKASK